MEPQKIRCRECNELFNIIEAFSYRRCDKCSLRYWGIRACFLVSLVSLAIFLAGCCDRGEYLRKFKADHWRPQHGEQSE